MNYNGFKLCIKSNEFFWKFCSAINAVDTLLKDAIEKNPSEVTPEFIQGAEEL